MIFLIGFSIIVLAGFLQGTFVLPMTMNKAWKWENSWLAFSMLGMLLFNWLLAAIFIPDLAGVFRSVPGNDLAILTLFGIGWGCGSVLFGIGMDRLGLSLGYPIIMGLIALLGAVIPLLTTSPEAVFSLRGLFLLTGGAVVLLGIMLCTRANTLKDGQQTNATRKKNSGAIMIAVAAGILSALPNVGASFAGNVLTAAKISGASEFMAGNAVWAIFFTAGFIPNGIYTIFLLTRNQSWSLFAKYARGNALRSICMGAMWIGSFYLYGMGAPMIGNWGLILGWPIYISFSIVVGNLWGIWRGEWGGTNPGARKKLLYGMLTIIAAMMLIGTCNFF